MSDPFHQYGFGRWVRDGGELSFEPLKAKRWESHFSIHFTPLVFFFVPFYLVFDGPLFLLIFQVVGVGLSAFLLYLIAWSVFQDRTAPFIIAVSYLFFRQLLLGLMHDIHLEMYFPLFLFSSYYFIVVKKNPFLFSLSVALALFIKEDIAFLLLFYGIFLFFKLKEKKYGFAVAAGSLLYLAAAMGIAIPFFRKISGMEGAYVYGHFGGSLIQIAGNILSHPAALFENIYMGLFLSKLSNIILPLLLLPLMTSYALLILPPLLVAILSKNPQNYSFGIHYSATLLPFVFLSLIYGLKNIKFFLEKKFSSRAGKIVGFILILLLVANLANSPFWRIIRPSRYRALGDYGQVARAISQIPGRLHSVAALSAIIPHIPKRKGIFMLPEMGEAEYILIHSGINLWPYTREEFSNFIKKIEQEQNYSCVWQHGEIRLFRKRGREPKTGSLSPHNILTTLHISFYHFYGWGDAQLLHERSYSYPSGKRVYIWRINGDASPRNWTTRVRKLDSTRLPQELSITRYQRWWLRSPRRPAFLSS